ncbi:hypothetical protein ADUPG1_004830, partial [Aduncisulcus paluster]
MRCITIKRVFTFRIEEGQGLIGLQNSLDFINLLLMFSRKIKSNIVLQDVIQIIRQTIKVRDMASQKAHHTQKPLKLPLVH